MFDQASQVLHRCRQQELVPGAVWAAQPKPRHCQVALRFPEQSLDLFAVAGGLVIGLATIQGAGVIAGGFVDIARDFSGRCARTASGLQRTWIAVALRRSVQERLAFGTDIDIAILIEAEVATRQCAVDTPAPCPRPAYFLRHR